MSQSCCGIIDAKFRINQCELPGVAGNSRPRFFRNQFGILHRWGPGPRAPFRDLTASAAGLLGIGPVDNWVVECGMWCDHRTPQGGGGRYPSGFFLTNLLRLYSSSYHSRLLTPAPNKGRPSLFVICPNRNPPSEPRKNGPKRSPPPF